MFHIRFMLDGKLGLKLDVGSVLDIEKKSSVIRMYELCKLT